MLDPKKVYLIQWRHGITYLGTPTESRGNTDEFPTFILDDGKTNISVHISSVIGVIEKDTSDEEATSTPL